MRSVTFISCVWQSTLAAAAYVVEPFGKEHRREAQSTSAQNALISNLNEEDDRTDLLLSYLSILHLWQASRYVCVWGALSRSIGPVPWSPGGSRKWGGSASVTPIPFGKTSAAESPGGGSTAFSLLFTWFSESSGAAPTTSLFLFIYTRYIYVYLPYFPIPRIAR